MMVSVPFSAALAPPEMPASTYSAPRSARAAWIRTVEAGDAVVRSTTTCEGRQCASTPPSPSTTASTTGLSGRDSRTTSAASASAPIDPAGAAPDASSAAGLWS